MSKSPSDDPAGLLVQRKMCATCIYRPDSPLDIAKLEADVADGYGGFKGSRTCHHSDSAVCAGFWKRHKDEFPMGQIAQRLGFVVMVDHDTLKQPDREGYVKFILVAPSNTPTIVESDGSLESLQGFVGGDLESIPFVEGAYVYVNENAKIQDDPPPPNMLATKLMQDLGGGLFEGDVILGPMLIVGVLDEDGEYDGEEHDVPDDVVRLVMGYRI